MQCTKIRIRMSHELRLGGYGVRSVSFPSFRASCEKGVPHPRSRYDVPLQRWWRRASVRHRPAVSAATEWKAVSELPPTASINASDATAIAWQFAPGA